MREMSTETRDYLRERRRQKRAELAAETSAAHAARVGRRAQAAFKDHTLTREGAHWRCGLPGTIVYSFNLYAAPGVLAIWGDIGVFTLRHGARDSLGWLASSVRSEDPDYVLGKLCASDGPIKQFSLGDVFRFIDMMIRESGNAARWRGVRATLHENLARAHGSDEQASAWYAACREHGGGDPIDGMTWAAGPLYLWHALRVFSRLHEPIAQRDRETAAAMAAMLGAHDVPAPSTPNQD